MCAYSNINKIAYFYAACCAVHVTIFSTGGEILPGFEILYSYTLLL